MPHTHDARHAGTYLYSTSLLNLVDEAPKPMQAVLDRLREALAPDFTVEGEIATGGMGTALWSKPEPAVASLAADARKRMAQCPP